MFAGLCFTNVALISAWEHEVDESQDQVSLARQFSRGATIGHVLPIVLAAIAALVATRFFGIARIAAECVTASSLLLAAVDRYEPKMGWQHARVLADVALLTPFAPLVYQFIP